MNQGAYIIGALFIAFLFFVTARGELPAYIAVFYGQ